MPLTQGQILNNRYRVARLLGQGGFGAVYKAWDVTLNRPCAVKESLEQDAGAGRQFLREAQILANLSHPNLPRVTDYFAVPGAGQYLVMDFVEGQDLEQMLAQAGGRLPEAQVLPWISQVCDALAYLHRQQPPVIHRDIKPANIKITPPDQDYPHGRAMLVDFGVAKTFDPALRTTLGARAVTPGYSPIEQYGQGTTDARSDIYALGATLYSLLTGEVPPEAPARVVQDTLIPPRQADPSLAPKLEEALLRALQMKPSARFQEAGEFKAIISEQLAGSRKPPAVVTQVLPVTQENAATPALSPLSPASPATSGIPLPCPARRFPWKWVGLEPGLLALLALMAVLIGLLSNPPGDAHLTQTSQARATQIAQAVAALLSQTPPSPTSTLIPTSTVTLTPSPLPPSPTSTSTLTPTPSPLPPSPTPMLGIGSTQVSPLDGMVMSYILAGTFQMGSESGDSYEQPVHAVTLDAFWMDQSEVTNGMYAQCVAAGACNPPDLDSSSTRSSYYTNAAYADYPVIYVDWNQAAAYCGWAGRQLPTEAQWEYSARGGLAGALYPWGDEPPSCTLGARNGAQNYSCSPHDTMGVGSFAPNGYGLYDMAGNVWEWVADWNGPYSSAAVENPSGPASGEYPVLRGGAWYDDRYNLRVYLRRADFPVSAYDHLGFRCSLSP